MYKYFFTLFTLLTCIFICCSISVASEVDFPSDFVEFNEKEIEASFFVGEKYLTWNESKVVMDVAPFIQNNRTYVPVRYLANSLGVENKYIDWDKKTQQVTLVLSAEKSESGTHEVVILTINKHEIFSTRKGIENMDVVPIIKNGRTFLPARFVAEAFGYSVNWNQKNKTVMIKRANSLKNKNLAAKEYPNKHVLITADFVNVRKGPGLNYEIIGQVKSGEKYLWLDSTDEWYELLLRDGIEGWVFYELAEVVAMREDKIVIASRDGDISEREEKINWLPSEQFESAGDDHNYEKNAGINGEKEELISADECERANLRGNALHDINVEIIDDKVMVNVFTGKDINYDFFILENPLRLVIDFQDIYPGDLNREYNINSDIVNRYRLGEFNSDPLITRLVFDLIEPVDYQIMNNGTEVVIKLEPQHKWPVKGYKVFIDPGHGGEDPGAIYYGIQEKDIVLDISNRMYNILKNQGAVVQMSRYDDVNLGETTREDLFKRAEMANSSGADIFVSIHANAHWSQNLSGIMTFHRREPLPGSVELAKQIQKELVNELQLEDKGVRKADFVVIRETNMPAVLVEVAFLSNQEDAMLLSEPAFRQRAAEAIVRGINNYFMY